MVGQERAAEAIRFGIEIRRAGFNVFVIGLPGSGKRTAVLELLSRQAVSGPPPDGWCYVHRFDDPSRPMALRLPPGRATRLKADVTGLVDELRETLIAAFDAEAYDALRSDIEAGHDARSRDAVNALRRRASEKGLVVVPDGDLLRFVPAARGDPMTDDEIAALPDERRRKMEAASDELRTELDATERVGRTEARQLREAIRTLDRTTAKAEVDWRVEELAATYADLPPVAAYLRSIGDDIVANLDGFLPQDDAPPETEVWPGGTWDGRGRYAVNVLVDAVEGGSPVVTEPHPTLPNLIGRIEYRQQYGAMSTDFTLIRPGALHKANGGYLVLEAADVLREMNSWEALKRALRTGEVRLEAVPDGAGTLTTEMPEPDPIALDCKIVLMGDLDLYHHLYEMDPDIAELFKVKAEFGDTMARDDAGEISYARFVSKVVTEENLLPLDAPAVARVIEYGARAADDAGRLTTRFADVADVIREADFWARKDGSSLVTAAHIDRANSQRLRRADLSRDLLLDAFLRDVVSLETEGKSIGQVNGITVYSVGDFDFGTPVRITARARLGGGEVVDIEREVELGGPMHSKGVLILGGFLGGRYLSEEQLAMAASLTFEQSGSFIDGDSASSAELCALLSAIALVPIDQGLAVTGSITQAGEVQAIGGVNDKIEGFFDVCRARGLTGTQGVLIPEANVQHLMLREDVIDAVTAGTFHVYPVRNVDDCMAILTGMPAGDRGADGEYGEGTVNRAVEDRLRRLAERRREIHHGDGESDDEEDGED